MIKTLLILWTLDPTGAGSVAITDMPSLQECYKFVARAQFPDTTRVACQPRATLPEVAVILADNRCELPAWGGVTFTCAGRK